MAFGPAPFWAFKNDMDKKRTKQKIYLPIIFFPKKYLSLNFLKNKNGSPVPSDKVMDSRAITLSIFIALKTLNLTSVEGWF